MAVVFILKFARPLYGWSNSNMLSVNTIVGNKMRPSQKVEENVPSKIRKTFLETWLWSDISNDSSRFVSIEKKLLNKISSVVSSKIALYSALKIHILSIF